jgi:hypothetical protein
MSFSISGIIAVTFTCPTPAAGPISVPGLKAGDGVLYWTDVAAGGYGHPGTLVEGIVTVDDQINQISDTGSVFTCKLVLVRSP